MSRVLAIGDLHSPAERKYYLEFVKDIYDQWGCNQVVFMGDLADWHSISFHARHPELPGPKDEYQVARTSIQRWHQAFPKAKVCIGNHDERVFRLAESVNIPAFLIRDYNEVWGTKGWEWSYDFTIDGVYYVHGTGCSGEHPAYNMCKTLGHSVVMGHIHTAAEIKYLASKLDRRWGMSVGTGVDDTKLQFAYGKHFRRRSIVSCGVIIDGHPYLEIMPMGKGEKYHDSKRRVR
ncbi:MAG: metallophosphoesterase [Saccharofermentanales bacterium]